jgi:hypothetical protein
MSNIYQGIVFYLILLLTVVSIFIFKKNKMINHILDRIFKTHLYQDVEMFKSRVIFLFLKYANTFFKNLYLALTVFLINYSIFMLKLEIFLLVILNIIVTPFAIRLILLPYYILFRKEV